MKLSAGALRCLAALCLAGTAFAADEIEVRSIDSKVRSGESYAVLQACLVAGSDVPVVTVLGGNMSPTQLEAITRFAREAKSADIPGRPAGAESCIQFRVILKPKSP